MIYMYDIYIYIYIYIYKRRVHRAAELPPHGGPDRGQRPGPKPSARMASARRALQISSLCDFVVSGTFGAEQGANIIVFSHNSGRRGEAATSDRAASFDSGQARSGLVLRLRTRGASAWRPHDTRLTWHHVRDTDMR